MKTIEERLADTANEIERQTALWDDAARALAALGDVPLRVPAAALADLDATVLRAHVVGTRRPLVNDGVQG
jgi:hypothetical protein